MECEVAVFPSLARSREWPDSEVPALSLIGAPSDIGAAGRGAGMGPEALRVAGLSDALRCAGWSVKDQGDVLGPANPGMTPIGGYRHLEETRHWCGAVRDAIYHNLVDGHLPVLLGGDHSLSMGSLAAVSRHCAERQKPLWVLWIDAHADFNTGQSSPSGNLHGMPLAVACGHGPERLTALGSTTPMVDSSRIFLFGVRSIDDLEQQRLHENHITVCDMQIIRQKGVAGILALFLDRVAMEDGHLHVSFDVDGLDPAVAPGTGIHVPNGISLDDARLCMELIGRSGLMASLDVMEINPALDIQNQTAEIAVDLLQLLFEEMRRQRSRAFQMELA